MSELSQFKAAVMAELVTQSDATLYLPNDGSIISLFRDGSILYRSKEGKGRSIEPGSLDEAIAKVLQAIEELRSAIDQLQT